MIEIKQIQELGRTNPSEAHKLVANLLGERGHKSFFEFKGRQQCIRKAMAKPLPGAAGDAFLRGSVKIDDRIIYEVMPIHHKALQAVNSPLLQLVGGAIESEEKKAALDIEPEDEMRICYIFTEHPKALYQVPKTELAAHIKAKAQELFEASSSAEINSICNAVIAQFHRHIKACVRRNAQLEGQVESSFFQELAGASKKPTA